MLTGKLAVQYPAAQDTKTQLGSPSKNTAHHTSDNKLFIIALQLYSAFDQPSQSMVTLVKSKLIRGLNSSPLCLLLPFPFFFS